MIVAGEGVARFVSEQVGAAICPPYSTMGLMRGDRLVAGVVFNQFEGFDVHVTLAGRGWTKGFVEAVGEYVFRQLGCLRLTATTEQPEVISYAQRLGGEVEGRLRDHFGPGRDGIIIGILRSEWKFGSFPPDCSAADRHFTRFPNKEACFEDTLPRQTS
ncbi:GNAT family N-acetyltransferase [Qipengyuania sp. MTN3-11]|uniref:GNAT family N-acetyltransferase n=1 Tax=Qipengyuania sp. MTN3-11 TaxID=3056557 RepID=UPI0036F30A08